MSDEVPRSRYLCGFLRGMRRPEQASAPPARERRRSTIRVSSRQTDIPKSENLSAKPAICTPYGLLLVRASIKGRIELARSCGNEEARLWF